MLLINDVIVNNLDSSFKIKNYEFIAKYKNIPILEKKLNLNKPSKKTEYYNIYSKNNKLYKIYNASVSDYLLELLDNCFCNDNDIKSINPLYQHSLDKIALKMVYQDEKEWFHILKRVAYLKNSVIYPLINAKLHSFIKVLNTESQIYSNWYLRSRILEPKNKPFKEFEKFCFEELISMSCGESTPVYTNLYTASHKYINDDEFKRLSKDDKDKAMFQLISTYTLNEYIVDNLNKKYSDSEIKQLFKKTYMKYACQTQDYTIGLYLRTNYIDIFTRYDLSFYSQFKMYMKYVN